MAPPRCYTVAQLLSMLQLSRSVFFMLKSTGQLPFLEELRPRIGRKIRFRADLVDRYLEGDGVRAAIRSITKSA